VATAAAALASEPRAGFVRARWEALLKRAERRLPSLTRYRARESLPIELHSRRIYVVPSRFGLFFGLTLAAMLIGALNFNNNPALMLVFLIAGAGQISLHRTVANMRGIALIAIQGAPVHAGDELQVALQFQPADGRERPRLRLAHARGETLFDLDAAGNRVDLHLATAARGWLTPGRVTVSTEYPLGLFHAWSVLNPDHALLVYARPEPDAPPLPRTSTADRGRESKPHGEDWYGLRDYRSGDAQRLIAWKASARQDRLLVKEFAEPHAAEVTLDWHALGAMPVEAKISRLTRWVLEAQAQNLAFSLVLPQLRIGPARGSEHGTRCLRELALLP